MRIAYICAVFALFLPSAVSSMPAQAVDITSPYPGTLKLQVDLTQAPRKIFYVHETIPVKSGPLTLYYPKWIPGEHSPSGPLVNVAGMVFTADGQTLT
jgi:hypothetical protein